MQQCGSSSRRNCSTNAQMGPVIPYSCDLFQAVDSGTGAFPIFFATSAINEQQQLGYDDPSSSPVDCTLSLGTPSTRHQSNTASKPSPLSVTQRQKRHNYPLCVDFLPLQLKRSTTPSAAANGGAAALGGGAAGGGGGLNLGRDPLLLRRCANCDTTSTPLWRNGPRGPKSLCNACGIRFKKEERRAASSAASMSSTSSSSSSSAAAHMESLPWEQHQQLATDYGYHHPRGYSGARLAAGHKCSSTTPAIFSAISLRENVDPMEATALSYLPWQRFNLGVQPQAAEFATSRFQD